MNPTLSDSAPSVTAADEKRARKRRRRSRRKRQWERVGGTSSLLVAVLIISSLGMGGLFAPILVVCSAVAVLSAVIVLREPGAKLNLFFPALVPLALSAFTLLQVLPIPMDVLTAIAPHNAQVWAHVLQPFREPTPRFGALTADRGATLVEALKWLTYAAVLVTAISVGARRGAAWGARTVFLVAVLLAAVTFVHGLVSAHLVYGLYEPTFSAARWRVGPLLNSNSLAGYLNLGLLCGLGSMLSRWPQLPRVALALGAATLLGVVFLSGSRAGVVAGVCGIGLLAIYVRLHHRSAEGSRRDLLLLLSLVGVAGGAGFLAWLGSTRESTNELLDKNIEKLEVLGHTKPLLLDHAIFGVGRGAFESVFPAYHVSPQNVVYAHAENFVVQWIADWGFPVGVAAVAGFLWMLHPKRLGAGRSVTAVGIWAGLVALALQNLLDLGFEIPAVAIEAAVCMGVAWGSARASVESSDEPPLQPSRWRERLAALAAAPAVALALAVLVTSGHGAMQDRTRIRNAIMAANLKSPDDATVVRDELRAATLRHPADPYFARVGGLLAWSSGRESPIPWIQRALERGPEIGATHLELARILAHHGARNQAFFELRLATSYQPSLMRRTAPLVAGTASDLDDVLRAVPEGLVGTRMLVAVANNRRAEFLGDLRESCLMEAIRRAPDLVEPRLTMSRDLIASIAGRRAESKCADARRNECVRWVEQQIVRLAKVHGEAAQAVLLMGELWIASGRAVDAEAMLGEECGRIEPHMRDRCAGLRIQAAAASGSSERVAKAVSELAANGCAAGAGCGSTFSSLGRQLEGVGRPAEALSYYRRAVTEDPSDAHWADVARAANAVGDLALAADAIGRLSGRHPTDATLRDRRIAAERKLLPTVLNREPEKR